MTLLLTAVLTALGAAGPAQAQAPSTVRFFERPPVPAMAAYQPVADYRLSKDSPALYISFERTGKALDPLDTHLVETRDAKLSQRSGKDIWLRLHNNSVWAVSLTTYGIHTSQPPELIKLPDGTATFLAADGQEVSIAYRLRRGDGRGIPVNPAIDTFAFSWVAPGRSILFSVPRAGLPKEWVVAVRFHYEWEQGQAGFGNEYGPVHTVEFWSYRLKD